MPTQGSVKLILLVCLGAMAKPVRTTLIPLARRHLTWPVVLAEMKPVLMFRLLVRWWVKQILQFRHLLPLLIQLNGPPLEKMLTPMALLVPTLLSAWNMLSFVVVVELEVVEEEDVSV